MRGPFCKCVFTRTGYRETTVTRNVYERTVTCCDGQKPERAYVTIGKGYRDIPVIGSALVTGYGIFNANFNTCECAFGLPADTCPRR